MHISTFVWIFWLASEVIMNLTMRAKTRKGDNPDRQSLAWIWIAISLSITGGILSAIYLPARMVHSPWPFYAGYTLILIGIALRFWAIRTLGRFFTVNLHLDENHHLVRNGLYKWIRHPSYAGALVSFLGLGLSMNNWISLFIIFLPVFGSFLYRIRLEETMLLNHLGAEYEAYMRSTKRLVPLLY
jgi:protein-S-isoprenylcysteine O-methyltransferase Ste14